MSRLSFDPERVSEYLADVSAREIMPRFRRLEKGDWREKSPGDIVTVADELAEAALTPLLTGLLPGSVLVGEESAARDPGVLARLAQGEPAWIVDPIDGTANFAEGKAEFCVMVALAQSDRLLASWIYVPVTGTLARSVVGEGAWVDGRKISSRVLEEGERLSGVIAVGQRGGADLVSRAQSLRQTARQIKSSRCAGLDYLRLAQGELDFVLFSGVMPWDHAPGVALLNEIGGQASYASGAAYRPSQASDAKGVLTARNSDIWRRVFDRLYPQGVGATSA